MAKSANKTISVTVTAPVYNERENIKRLYLSAKKVLDSLGLSWEIIFVDDGSTDGTRSVLKELAENDDHLRVIFFKGNFGQSAAMGAGFKHARGDVVIAMDSDLQNDPEDIPLLLNKLKEGFDVVAGWRKNRQDKLFIRKIPSKIANRIICSVTGVKLHDTGCSLKAFRREVVKNIRIYGELHRFIPVLARIEGARIAEVAVRHHARRFGKSKYNITRTFRVLMDLASLNVLLKYLRNPLRFFGAISMWFLSAAVVVAMVYAFFYTRNAAAHEQTNVLITLLFLMAISGFQFLCYGLIASLIVKTGTRRGVGVSPVIYTSKIMNQEESFLN